MPITTIGSYPPTMQDFISSWATVNASLGATPLLLRGAYSLANFTADRAAIVTAINNVIAADNLAQTQSANLANQKLAIRIRAIQFRQWVSGYLPGSVYVPALPDTPSDTAAESRFLDPLQDMLDLWTKINADATLTGVPLPLTLANGYLLATFTTDLTNLRALYVSAKNASEQASFIRRQRDILLKPAVQRMKQYRDIIPARFDANSPFVLSLPALNPPPGSTPDPVQFNGEWDAVKKAAVLRWTPSDNSNLAYYSLRVCVGKTYKVANEFAVAEIDSSLTTFETTEGLINSGANVVYRIYVVLKTGNEKGSNNVAITRP